MVNDEKAYQEMQASHLSMLTIYGRDYLNVAASAVDMLKSDFLAESPLSNAEKGKILDMLADTIRKHLELLKWTVEERQKLLDSTHNEAD